MGFLGYEEGCHALDLEGPTPRDPVALVAWGRTAAKALADAKTTLACDEAGGGKLTAELVKCLVVRCNTLNEAIEAVIAANGAEAEAREARLEAIEAFDGEYKRGARLLESALDYFGLPSLAATVRPDVQRREQATRRYSEKRKWLSQAESGCSRKRKWLSQAEIGR